MSKKRLTALLVCIAVAIAGLGYLIYYYADLNNKSKIYNTLRQVVESETGSRQSQPSSGDLSSSPFAPAVSVDFAALQKKNRDIYAWIKIPDTVVDYPVAQSATDQSYYLNHTIEGKSGYPGSIYTENFNKKDFSDFNTIIYGHDMKNGSMFGSLNKYRDASYLNKHREILIETPSSERIYKIFAAVVYSNAYLPQKFDFSVESGRKAFLDSIFDNRDMNSQILKDISVGTDSKILTLSTCVGGQPNNRYLIEAVYTG